MVEIRAYVRALSGPVACNRAAALSGGERRVCLYLTAALALAVGAGCSSDADEANPEPAGSGGADVTGSLETDAPGGATSETPDPTAGEAEQEPANASDPAGGGESPSGNSETPIDPELGELEPTLGAEGMEPETMEPETMDPEGMEPETMDPETMEPETMDPEGMEPETMEPPEPVDYPEDPFGNDPESVTIESGIGWIEGPTWVPDEGGFIYNLTDRDTPDIHRIWRPGQNDTSEYWRVPGSNHGAIWSEGLIFMTNREPGRIGYIDPSQDPLEETVIRDGLGRPNDLDRFSDGSLYFSDWPRGDTGVYRLQLNGDMERVISPDDVGSPNGIAFTSDCTRLYVAETGSGVEAFDVDADGNLSNQRTHVRSGDMNGIAVDVAGNLYTPNGRIVTVYDADGDEVGRWDPGQAVVNMTFGGDDHRWLLVTSSSGVTAVRTQIPGGECNGLGTARPGQ